MILKECPFCGSGAEILPDEKFADYWNVQCSNDRCGVIMPDVSQRHAAIKWNRRHAERIFQKDQA